MQRVILDFPSLDVFPSYIEALKEGYRIGIQPQACPEEIKMYEADPQAHIKQLAKDKTGEVIKAPDGSEHQCVPHELLWIFEKDVFIGSLSFRLELNEFLTGFGGHVGYGIRPTYQRKGYGTHALKLLRQRAKHKGMENLLVTCSPDNPASEKIILNNGGKFWDISDNTYGFSEVTKRYWVPV